MISRACQSVLLAVGLMVCAGCFPNLPDNAKPIDPPNRTILHEVPDGSIETEDDVTDSVWLEVNRPSGGTIGGYLSQNDSPQKALVIILHGASTFSLTGEVGSALYFQETFGISLQNRGYMTWSLAYPECGTPYGQDDLQSVLDAIDWLYSVGQTALGVERVYVAGYSTGGTLSILANRQRLLSGVASVSGLTEPASLEDSWTFFKWVAGLYPANLGICQMGETLDYYGPPGDPRWDALDSVAHFDELHSPMILLHGTDDWLFSVNNARDMEDHYNAAKDQGLTVPDMAFVYIPDVSHFPDMTDASVDDPIRDFFDSHAMTTTAPAPN